MSGFKKPGKRVVDMLDLFADTFNPIGNAGMSMQTLAPTALDPLIALTENRDFTGKPELAPPWRAARVTGALFHTQGGLVVDEDARVLRGNGAPLPNLFAGGGAARGVSGSGAAGYIAGNGLLTATGMGRLAGLAAARLR